MRTKPITGTIAREAIQCVCPDTGETGSFLFTGESHRNPGSRVSPIFSGLAGVFEWANANGWESESGVRIYREDRTVEQLRATYLPKSLR